MVTFSSPTAGGASSSSDHVGMLTCVSPPSGDASPFSDIVAASIKSDAAASTFFAADSYNIPPYRDMVLSAFEALKHLKPLSLDMISMYIAENYSNLPSIHPSLTFFQLCYLHSQNIIRKIEDSYELVPPPGTENSGSVVGSKKRGRPRNAPAQIPAPVFYTFPKRRGRPPKLGTNAPPTSENSGAAEEERSPS